MTKAPTTKLSIYLIKKDYSSPEYIFKDREELQVEVIDDRRELYYGHSYISRPPWVKSFFPGLFNNNTNDNTLGMYNASAKAVLLAHVEDRYFALSFGYGHTLLRPGVWEERFGLKTALNVIDLENLRSIEKKNMSVTPKLSIEQMTKDGKFTDFGINIEQDLIQGITGKTLDRDFGRVITGKDALSLSGQINIENINSFLIKCYKKYRSNGYKKNFGWIDHVFQVKNITKLDEKLIQNIMNGDFNSTSMAVPDVIRWEDVSHFQYNRHSLGDDIYFPEYWGYLTEKKKQSLSVKVLKNDRIDCISAASNTSIKSWTIYSCLYCEIRDEDKIYILSGGKWYQIESNFAKEIINSFESIKETPVTVSLPKYNKNEKEGEYNTRATKEMKGVCNMDGNLIYHDGIYQIEFCDLFTKDKEIIHVKRYRGSSVLSHLFFQGLVSGELFLSDQAFREKLNEKLPDDYKLENISDKPDASDYKIIFAIISKKEEEGLDIPFFSKMNIRNAKRRLETFGYAVSLLKIETAKEYQ